MMWQRQRCNLAYPSQFCVFVLSSGTLLDRSMMRLSHFVRIHSLRDSPMQSFDMQHAIVAHILHGLIQSALEA